MPQVAVIVINRCLIALVGTSELFKPPSLSLVVTRAFQKRSRMWRVKGAQLGEMSRRKTVPGTDAAPSPLDLRTKQNARPERQVGVSRNRGATLDELEELYRRLFDVFVRVAASVTGDSERGRDAVQEGFATAVSKRSSFRREGPLEAWVWRIVLNAARSDVRRSSPAVGYDQVPSANGQPDRDAELRVALAHLPERQRTAVFLRYYADLDYAAIGEALGIRTGTVAATLNAAHAALHTELEEARA